MTPEIALKVLGVVVVVALALWALRRLQSPKRKTRRLAITVWAAFGPYDTAENAEAGLYRASRAVFGREGIPEHEEWLHGHIRNFRVWQANGRLQGVQRLMRAGLLLTAYGHAFEAACKQVKAEAAAQVLETMEGLNKDLEKTGHKLEAITQPDGALQLVCKQLWSDEEIQRHQREVGEAMFNVIGGNLLEDRSSEAQQLLAFLSVVYQANMSKALETPKDVGIIWFACLEVVDKDQDSVVAQTFKVLNEAWNVSKRGRKEQSGYGVLPLGWTRKPGCFERHLQRKHGNPLFPSESRIVTQEQIDEAKLKDLSDAETFRDDFEHHRQEVLAMPPTVSVTEISALREKIDDMLDRAPQIGGDTVEEIEQILSGLREVVVSLWRKAAQDNHEALEVFNIAENFTNSEIKKFRNSFVAQVHRENSPIEKEETLAALLSESPETIRVFMSTMENQPEIQKQARNAAIRILRDAIQTGISIPQLEEKLQALGMSES